MPANAAEMALTSTQTWDRLLAPYQPQLPLPALVEEVNKLFHRFEAASYDRRHPQIFQQGAQLWREMIRATLAQRPAAGWRILDFGCGTGFASSQLLAELRSGAIEELVCYDLSPEMLQQCQAKIAPQFARARFANSLEEVAEHGPYTVLATNSLLHHLPDPLGTIQHLQSCLTADALWLSGQEPSSRFYRNPACCRHYEAFRQGRRQRSWTSWTRWVQPSTWSAKCRKLFGNSASPKALAARAAWEQGLFKQRPPALLIDRLVDFHVAHSADEAQAGRGFDYHELERQLQPHWRLAWFKSYSYMGPLYEGSLPHRWQAACRHLADQYPQDGANFCAVWQRT